MMFVTQPNLLLSLFWGKKKTSTEFKYDMRQNYMLWPNLAMVYKEMLWLIKNISQFFLFSKSKSRNTLAPNF